MAMNYDRKTMDKIEENEKHEKGRQKSQPDHQSYDPRVEWHNRYSQNISGGY